MHRESRDGWHSHALGDLFDMQLGKMLSAATRVGPRQRPYLANRNVQWNRIDLSDIETMHFNPPEDETYGLTSGDILVCEGGEIGRTAIWDDELDNCHFQNAIHRLRPRHDTIAPRYLLHFMRFAAEHGLFRHLSGQTSIAHLTKEGLRQLVIPVPSVSEQARIIKILDAVDEAIHLRERLIAKLEKVSQGLHHDLLTRGIDKSGELRHARGTTKDLAATRLGLLPSDWQVTTLGAVIASGGGFIQTGPFGSQLHAHEYTHDGVPTVMPQDIQHGEIKTAQIARVTEEKARSLSRHRMHPGDVIFARRGDLSKCAAIRPEHEGWLCGTGSLLVRTGGGMLSTEWLAAFYGHDMSQRQIGAAAVGSTMVNLNASLLGSLLIALPQRDEQDRVVSVLKAHQRRIGTAATALRKLCSIKCGLLEDLFTGRVGTIDEVDAA